MRYFLLLLLVTTAQFLSAQDGYFQQKVDVQINCTLNDTKHQLKGDVTMQYTNNSPHSLEEIYMHLWPNAYKDRATAFTQQKLRMKNTEFYFAEDKERGNLSELLFKVDGDVIKWDYTEDNIDIAILKLKSPIKPGQTIEIKTPFLLQIPKSFSRLGYVGESYQISQWYPKPAVYDQEGWHPMPYYDVGEFYSEFGDYEVTITLPENYVVAATGEVQEENEKAFLMEQVKKTKTALEGEISKTDIDFPPSSNKMKTITFKAENVHDFAWFADKRFHVMKSKVMLNNEKEIDTWTFFTNHQIGMWPEAIHYVDRSVKFYSDNVGDYPYPQATAVYSALGAGGGMEYPMITVIGTMGDPKSLDNVITHEVGHNWFYGILAFNERDHVWMDEGINSYFDHRYMSEFYEDYSMFPLPKVALGNSPLKVESYALLYKMRRNEDQAPSSHSNSFNSEFNYFIGGYEKPAQAFRHLELYLGTIQFDFLMKGFYEKWKFKHPQPIDLRVHFEEGAGKDLAWFFDGLIGSNKNIDYKITKVNTKKNTVTIKNKGQIGSPIPLEITNDDEQTILWIEGFSDRKTIQLDANKISKIKIDPNYETLEINTKNNQWRSNKVLSKVDKLQLQFLSKLEHPENNQLFVTPIMGWNDQDKYMLGIGIHNYGIIQKSFEYALLPMYSFGTGSISGMATMNKHWKSYSNWFKELTVGFDARKFTYNDREIFDIKNDLSYLRLNPFINFRLRTKSGASRSSNLKLELVRNQVDFSRVNLSEVSKFTESYNLFRIGYDWQDRNAIKPKKLMVDLEYQKVDHSLAKNEYLKLSTSFHHKYQFKEKKFFEMRYFMAYFILNDKRDNSPTGNPLYFTGGNISLISQAQSDYAFDDYYFGRSAQRGLFSNQVSNSRGGFKVPILQQPNSYSKIGLSNDFAFSINLRSDLPFKLPSYFPLKVFADFGYVQTSTVVGSTGPDPLIWSTGLMLSYAGGRFEVYLPMFNSKEIEDAFDQIGGGFFNRLSFSFDISRFNITKERNGMF